MRIKEVVRYECMNGELFNSLVDAEKYQFELNAKHELTYLVQDNGVFRMSQEEDVVDFIWEHRCKLIEILKNK